MNKPLYIKIKEEIIEIIEPMEVHSAITSERDLAAHFSASRMTVRKAIDALVEEGVLYRDSNRGTFVADKVVHQKNTLADIGDDIHYSMIYFDVKTSSSEEVWRALNISKHDSIVRMIRLKLEGKDPIGVEEIYIKRNNLTDKEVNNMAKWRVFNDFVDAQGTIHHVFNPELVPIKYANLLEMKIGTPIIVVNSIIRSKRGDPLVYRKTYNNTNTKMIEISSSI